MDTLFVLCVQSIICPLTPITLEAIKMKQVKVGGKKAASRRPLEASPEGLD